MGPGGDDDDRGRATLDERTGVLVAVGAYLIWGLLTVYWKQLSDFDAVELIGWRMTAAAVVMAAIVIARGHVAALSRSMRDPAVLAFLVAAACLLAGNWGTYVWAVINDRVIETALGYFLAPLATMAIGVLVLGETPSRAQRLAFVLAAIAGVILTVEAGRPPWVALLLAGTWSLYGLTKRRVPLDAIDSLAGETFVLFVPALVVLSIVGTGPGAAIESASGREWVFLLGTGIVTAVPLMLFAGAAKSIPFTLLGPLNLLVPVITFGLGWLLYDEPMPPIRVVGFAFVWVALAVVMWDRIRSGRRRSRRVELVST